MTEALRLADLGWPVMRLSPGTKIPFKGTNGVKDATTDPVTIRQWWTEDPNANLGLAIPAGVIALDVDPPALEHFGPEWIAELELKFADHPRSSTPRCGWHFLCCLPHGTEATNSAGRLGQGLDIRAKGGYIVVHPSVNGSGRWSWVNRLEVGPDELPLAPVWLLDQVQPKTDACQKGKPTDPTAEANVAPETIRRATSYLQTLPRAVQGKAGHSALFTAARVLVRGFLLPETIAMKLLVEVFNPRCSPPWEGIELERHFSHKLREARSKPYDKPEGWLLDREGGVEAHQNGVVGQASAGSTEVAEGEPVYRRLDTVPREEVRWLWPGRIPLGKLTVIAGDPGLGKSFVAMDLVARVTTGARWPDQSGERAPIGSAIILNAEDGVGDTIVPRLDDLGADLSKVYFLEGVCSGSGKEKAFTLEDLEPLRKLLAKIPDCRVVVIDPVSAYGGRIDSHNNAEVRQQLAELGKLAEEAGVAVVAVTHLSKSGEAKRASSKVMGSLAYVAAPRAVWLVGRDPDDDDGRVLANVKMNIAKPAHAWGFRVDDGVLRWGDAALDCSADDLVGEPKSEDAPARSEAEAFLQNLLADPEGVPAKQVYAEAKEAGIAKRTLDRAKQRLGVQSERRGGPGDQGGWWWVLREPGSHAEPS